MIRNKFINLPKLKLKFCLFKPIGIEVNDYQFKLYVCSYCCYVSCTTIIVKVDGMSQPKCRLNFQTNVVQSKNLLYTGFYLNDGCLYRKRKIVFLDLTLQFHGQQIRPSDLIDEKRIFAITLYFVQVWILDRRLHPGLSGQLPADVDL